MDIGCAQFDRSFEQVVDGAYDRGAAGKVAQAFDIILDATLRRVASVRRTRLVLKPGGERRCNVLE